MLIIFDRKILIIRVFLLISPPPAGKQSGCKWAKKSTNLYVPPLSHYGAINFCSESPLELHSSYFAPTAVPQHPDPSWACAS